MVGAIRIKVREEALMYQSIFPYKRDIDLFP